MTSLAEPHGHVAGPNSLREGNCFVEVQEEALDVLRYTAEVAHPGAGAIASFIGVTRDSFQGKAVEKLEYEAYVPMALRKLLVSQQGGSGRLCTGGRRWWSAGSEWAPLLRSRAGEQSHVSHRQNWKAGRTLHAAGGLHGGVPAVGLEARGSRPSHRHRAHWRGKRSHCCVITPPA